MSSLSDNLAARERRVARGGSWGGDGEREGREKERGEGGEEREGAEMGQVDRLLNLEPQPDNTLAIENI